MRARSTIFVLAASAIPACCVRCSPDPPAKPSELTVFIAASMLEVLEDVTSGYQAKTGIRSNLSAAASGVLRRQIQAGAACDLFIAADGHDMDELAAGKLILVSTRRDVARNRLVVASCSGSAHECTSLNALADPGMGSVVIGDPAYVPAGRYARQALLTAGVWDTLEDRLIFADSVRVACQYLRTGQASFGIVYATDVARMPDLHVAFAIDAAASGACVAPAAVCTASRFPGDAADLLAYICAGAQRPTWAAHGFEPPR